MANFEVVFLDGKGNTNYIRCLKKFHIAKAHADSVAGQVWVNYIDKYGKMDRKKIYPKEKPQLTYDDLRELNDVLVRRFTKNELPNSMMFEYTVEVGDYSLGGYEVDRRYFGLNRNAAFCYWKNGKDWLGCSKIKVEVVGRKEKKQEEDDSWSWLFEDDDE